MTDTRTAQEMAAEVEALAEHSPVPSIKRKLREAATLIASQAEEIERLTAGLSALVHCQSALSRSQMREAAAWLLTVNGRKTKRFEDSDQSPFVLRALTAEAALAKAVEALNDIAEHTDPDSGENYRADDREGCLDTVHSLAIRARATTEKGDRHDG